MPNPRNPKPRPLAAILAFDFSDDSPMLEVEYRFDSRPDDAGRAFCDNIRRFMLIVEKYPDAVADLFTRADTADTMGCPIENIMTEEEMLHGIPTDPQVH